MAGRFDWAVGALLLTPLVAVVGSCALPPATVGSLFPQPRRPVRYDAPAQGSVILANARPDDAQRAPRVPLESEPAIASQQGGVSHMQPKSSAPSPEAEDEIAHFDENRRHFEASSALFQRELEQALLDESLTQRLQQQLAELRAEFPIEVQAQALCTRSVCEVEWSSSEPLETLIPLLAPWLMSQAHFSVGDGSPSGDGSEARTDFIPSLRFLLSKG